MAKSNLNELINYFYIIPGYSAETNIINNNSLQTHLTLKSLTQCHRDVILLSFHSQSTNKFNQTIVKQFNYNLNNKYNINLFWLAAAQLSNQNLSKETIIKKFSNKETVKTYKAAAIKILKETLQVYCKHCDNYFSNTKAI